MTTTDVVGRVDESLAMVSERRRSKEHAMDDFIYAVLNASAAGASQRMIGDAAGLSHARIGQIIRQYRTKKDWE